MSFALPAAGRIDVWRISLAGEPAAAEAATLDPHEALRATRFAFARDRARFVRARAAMRRILGGYLGLAPHRVRFALGAHGKPRLADDAFGFNLSHSGEHALLAVGQAAHVGVDVEQAAGRLDMRLLAGELFTQAENRALAGVADAELPRPFLTCWTRKEAVLKALGFGLAVEPRRIHVGTAPERRPVDSAGISPYPVVEVASLDLGPGVHGALAVVGSDAVATVIDLAQDGGDALWG